MTHPLDLANPPEWLRDMVQFVSACACSDTARLRVLTSIPEPLRQAVFGDQVPV